MSNAQQGSLDLLDESPLADAVASFHGEHRFLSNFWPCVIYLDGELYNSVEHAYVASKTLDLHERARVRATESPGAVKRIGRTLKLREDFNDIKVDIMRDLLRQKFSPGSALSQRLIETGDRMLIEGNRWGDTFWGVCRNKGENHLGKLLMQIREDLNVQYKHSLQSTRIRP